jgi:hypothetical protein
MCEFCQERHQVGSDTVKLKNCGHMYCKDMFRGWLDSKVTEAAIHPICFAACGVTVDDLGVPQCKTPIDDQDIRAHISPELLEKFERFKNHEEQPNLRSCPKCSFEQVGAALDPEMTCEQCENKYCFEHAGAHPDKTCTEYELEHRRENKLNEAYLEGNSKPCPKCKAHTQKNLGCNHMTCPKCKAGWCWICGEEIGNDTIPEHFRKTQCSQFSQSEALDYSRLTYCEAGVTHFTNFLIQLLIIIVLPVLLAAFIVGVTLWILLQCLPCFPKRPVDDDDTSDLRTNMAVCFVSCFILLPVFLVLSPIWIFIGSWLNRLQQREQARQAGEEDAQRDQAIEDAVDAADAVAAAEEAGPSNSDEASGTPGTAADPPPAPELASAV